MNTSFNSCIFHQHSFVSMRSATTFVERILIRSWILHELALGIDLSLHKYYVLQRRYDQKQYATPCHNHLPSPTLSNRLFIRCFNPNSVTGMTTLQILSLSKKKKMEDMYMAFCAHSGTVVEVFLRTKQLRFLRSGRHCWVYQRKLVQR